MAEGANEKNGGSKKLLIIAVVVIIILLCAVGAMAALLVSKSNETKKPVVEKPKEVVTAENVEEVVQQMEEDQKSRENIPQHYTVTQNSDWTFPDGYSESSNAFVKNDASNETPVYFDLIVDDTQEVIYSSPILELGAEIKNFKLDKPLEAGTYTCTIHYHLVDDEQNELTYVDIGVTVIVEK